MSDANVLSALDRQTSGYKRPTLNNIIIYGRVRCIIRKPDIIGTGVRETNGHFAIIDAYALKCLGEDYFRDESTYDVNCVYFTKGSILIYIDDKSWVGKDVKVFGKSKSFGATIRRQNCNKDDEGISAFMFGAPVKEGMKSVYPLVPNVLVTLNSRDSDARGTALEDFLVTLASSNGKIPYPETLDCLIPYTGISEYIEVPVHTIEDKSVEQKPVNVRQAQFESNTSRVDVSKIDMKLVYHLKGQEQSKYFDDFKEDIALNAKARQDFVKSTIYDIEDLIEEYGVADFNFLKRNFIENVASYPQRSLGGRSNIKCKQFIESFVDECGTVLNSDEDEDNDSRRMNVKLGIEKLRSNVLADNSLLWGDSGDVDIDKIPMLSDNISFVTNVIGTCTGIGYSTLVRNHYSCKRRHNISTFMWIFMLLRCPYVLGLLGAGLSVADCDLIYYSFGSYFDAGELEEVNMQYRSYLVMLDTLDACTKGKYRKSDRGRGINTFVKQFDYKHADCCYPDKSIKNLQNTGFVGNPEIKDLLQLLLDKTVVVPENGVNTIRSKNWYNQDLFDELCEAGIVNTLDNYCALERDIEREFLIYEVFEKKGKAETGITDRTIEKVISDFEESRGFKLEALQKDGIKLCKYKAGVLSGCAGSGKTTTSDCMTEVLKTLGGDTRIIYCTPTGKACRRLAEVVRSTVKTIHSQFNVSIGATSYLQSAYSLKKDSKNGSGKGVIYILDEMAMCNTELMYNIAVNITDDDMVYFLGDIKQLPPIGGGCPFKILMTVLPCVELGVSKRAAEGSLVNYNTSLINFMSDNYCRELLYDDKTFIERDCPDVNISSTVRSVFAGFMGGSLNGTKYEEDDIQVISGYQKEERLSSTARLNKPLQELLRRDDPILYHREVRVNGEDNEPFYLNDRVIYVNKNSYDICRYVYEKGIFHQVATFGCVNGEMGKLVGVVRSTDAVIESFSKGDAVAGEGYYSEVSEDELKSVLLRYESKKDDLRNDGNLSHDDFYFIVIKVYDTDLKRDVVVLLRGKGRYVGTDFCLSGSDLDNLGLAYALTCHKMQGSQSPVVIAAFESQGSPDFLNRNMINTIITRSQGIVCCVGSVLGSDSMLNRGRTKVSKVDSRDILSIMSGTAKWIEG